MKVLVTGAAGFMGSHLFDYLRVMGHDVIGLDNYSIGDYVHEDIFKIDLLDKDGVADFIKAKSPEVIYHLAAWAHEGLSQFSPIKITQNNYAAYLNLLVPAIRENNFRRIVVTSSMSVYGNQTPPFFEDMERKPVDIYGLAKTAMERSTELLSQVHKFEYNIVRPHNVYGERQNMGDPYRNVVAIFINSCLRNKPLYIYGDGEQKRAFTYVGDVTPYIAMLGDSKIKNQIFNIGPQQEYTINKLADLILEHFPTYRHTPKYISDRPLEVKEAYCTSYKAERLLGYRTHISFDRGLEKMIRWAKQQGGKTPRYMSEGLEIEKGAPETWLNKLI